MHCTESSNTLYADGGWTLSHSLRTAGDATTRFESYAALQMKQLAIYAHWTHTIFYYDELRHKAQTVAV